MNQLTVGFSQVDHKIAMLKILKMLIPQSLPVELLEFRSSLGSTLKGRNGETLCTKSLKGVSKAFRWTSRWASSSAGHCSVDGHRE